MPDKVYSLFYILLRSGLWNRSVPDADVFKGIDRQTWIDIYKLSCSQTVQGIVYEGVQRLPDDMLPPDDILIRWVAVVGIIERDNERMNNTIIELMSVIGALDCDVVLLKGQSVASLYNNPGLRLSGDIDLYFPDKKDFLRAELSFNERGFSTERHSDKSYSFYYDNTIVEVHSELIDIYNPFSRPYLNKLVSEYGFETFMTDSRSGYSIKQLSPVLNCVMINAHIMKHAFTSGIGLRQICDLAKAYAIYGYTEQLCEIYDKLGMGRWNILLNTFLDKYILEDDFKLVNIPVNEDIDGFKELIHTGGNLGRDFRENDGKLDTFMSMRRHMKMRRYARSEYWWMMVHLLSGLINNLTLFSRSR